MGFTSVKMLRRVRGSLAVLWAAVLLTGAGGLRAQPAPHSDELRFEHPDSDGSRLLLPPGPFTDGNEYKIEELKGKVVVLLWFDVARKDAVLRTVDRLSQAHLFAERPVIYLAIALGDRAAVANAFAGANIKLCPVGFDPGNILGMKWFISGRGESFSVFNPDGDVCVWSSVGDFGGTVASACENAKWKYKDDGYNKALDPAIALLEWNHYAEGLKLLRPLRKDGRKAVAESAEKLYGVVKAEADKWKADAEKNMSEDPVKAYQLYSRLAAAYVGEDMGKEAAEMVKKLKATKEVTDELSAREMLNRISTLPYDKVRSGPAATDLLKQVVAKYPNTPAAALANRLLHGSGAMAPRPPVN